MTIAPPRPSSRSWSKLGKFSAAFAASLPLSAVPSRGFFLKILKLHTLARWTSISAHAEALQDGQYADLVNELMSHGYAQTTITREFQLQRTVPARDGGPDIKVLVDFLMPKDAVIKKKRPKLVENFRVQRADGADLAVHFHELVAVSSLMPTGGRNTVEIAVCSIPALLAMKGYALEHRHKRKDAYDVHFCIRNYPGGPAALARDCKLLLHHESAIIGYRFIASKFNSLDGYGPTSVRTFVAESSVQGDLTPDQWQQDAFGQVHDWLTALGLPEEG